VEATDVSTEGAKASAAERQQAHEAAMQRQVLDWVEVVRPERGDILCLRVPNQFFVYPGTDLESITDEQRSMMETCHSVLGTLIEAVARTGIQPGGAAVIGEDMTLENLPPPWEKHPDAKPKVEVPSRLLLPPGTKI
jgi:hypothetical protein